MDEFEKLIDKNNKIKYLELLEYISTISLMDFISEITCPFILGKGLFEGDLFKDPEADCTSTMRFRLDPEMLAKVKNVETQNCRPDKETTASAISKAIYVVTKRRDSYDTRKNVITIGRSLDNDLTIADYVISKRHAAIHVFSDEYFIEDLGSTNGVSINGMKLDVNNKIKLSYGDTIAFGRYSFVFTKPIELFNRMR